MEEKMQYPKETIQSILANGTVEQLEDMLRSSGLSKTTLIKYDPKNSDEYERYHNIKTLLLTSIDYLQEKTLPEEHMAILLEYIASIVRPGGIFLEIIKGSHSNDVRLRQGCSELQHHYGDLDRASRIFDKLGTLERNKLFIEFVRPAITLLPDIQKADSLFLWFICISFFNIKRPTYYDWGNINNPYNYDLLTIFRIYEEREAEILKFRLSHLKF